VRHWRAGPSRRWTLEWERSWSGSSHSRQDPRRRPGAEDFYTKLRPRAAESGNVRREPYAQAGKCSLCARLPHSPCLASERWDSQCAILVKALATLLDGSLQRKKAKDSVHERFSDAGGDALISF
jgi:hypothetical protein